MSPGYIYLSIAVIAEVIATTALKASDGFTVPLPSIIVVLGYGLAFFMLSLVLRTVPMGIAYAIWAGLGIVLITIAGAIVYRQVPDLPALIGMTMIVGGVVVINMFSKSTGH